MASAHVAYAYSRREGPNSRGTYHLILNEPLRSGRLHRNPGDALCTSRRFWGLDPRPELTEALCARCTASADRHGVTVQPTP